MINYALLTVAAILLAAAAWHTYAHESIKHKKVGGIHFIFTPSLAISIAMKKKGA